jgi:hypothetical protein
MNEAGIRVANRAGPQAQEAWWRGVEPIAPQRSRWPFTVLRRDKEVSSSGANNPSTFSFTT